MPRGQLPDPNARRRNKPTIPTTNLPAGGRKGAVPKPPAWTPLAASGAAWWKWAWKTPQAAGWSDGDLSAIARRASLEDDLAVLDNVDSLDIVLEDIAEADTIRQVKAIVGRLAALCTGRTQVIREMRELDNLLGLTPKGMAMLRWKIVAEPEKAKAKSPATVTNIGDERRARLIANA